MWRLGMAIGRMHMAKISRALLGTALMLAGSVCLAQPPNLLESRVLPPAVTPGAAVRPYLKLPLGPIVLTHARVIDGTGQAVQPERTIFIADGRIVTVTNAVAP